MGEIIFLGLIIGIIFYELTDISPGGIVVPGILAYYLYDPSRILMTVIVSVIVYLVVRLLSGYMVLYGKRKFVVHVIMGVLLSALLGLVTKQFELHVLAIPLIGYIVPGIIGNEISKQGILKTVSALTIVVLLTGLVVYIL